MSKVISRIEKTTFNAGGYSMVGFVVGFTDGTTISIGIDSEVQGEEEVGAVATHDNLDKFIGTTMRKDCEVHYCGVTHGDWALDDADRINAAMVKHVPAFGNAKSSMGNIYAYDFSVVELFTTSGTINLCVFNDFHKRPHVTYINVYGVERFDTL